MSSKKEMPPNSWRQGQMRPGLSQSTAHRVREPVTRSRGLVRGHFPSTKNGRMVAWESQLEERACYLFEFTPAIKTFREQPIEIEYPHDGNIRTYIADFEITLCDGQICYIEIKPLEKLFHPEEVNRYRSISKAFERKREYWFVLTEENLPSSIKFQNLKLLRSYLRSPISDPLIQHITQWLRLGNERYE